MGERAMLELNRTPDGSIQLARDQGKQVAKYSQHRERAMGGVLDGKGKSVQAKFTRKSGDVRWPARRG